MRNTSLMTSINVMKRVYIFSICMLFSSQTLASDVETSLVTYRDNFNQVFPCSDEILCLDDFMYREDAKDFVLVIKVSANEVLDKENIEQKINGYDMIITYIRDNLISVDGDYSFILSSKNDSIDELMS